MTSTFRFLVYQMDYETSKSFNLNRTTLLVGMGSKCGMNEAAVWGLVLNPELFVLFVYVVHLMHTPM